MTRLLDKVRKLLGDWYMRSPIGEYRRAPHYRGHYATA